MARKSKFKIGMEVTSLLNPLKVFEVLSILKNELIVCDKSTGLEYTAKKYLFKPVEVEN